MKNGKHLKGMVKATTLAKTKLVRNSDLDKSISSFSVDSLNSKNHFFG